MRNILIPFTIALFLGLAQAEIDQEYINDKIEEVAEKTCYIYGDFSVFDLRDLAARKTESEASDYSYNLGTGGTLYYNYC